MGAAVGLVIQYPRCGICNQEIPTTNKYQQIEGQTPLHKAVTDIGSRLICGNCPDPIGFDLEGNDLKEKFELGLLVMKIHNLISNNNSKGVIQLIKENEGELQSKIIQETIKFIGSILKTCDAQPNKSSSKIDLKEIVNILSFIYLNSSSDDFGLIVRTFVKSISFDLVKKMINNKGDVSTRRAIFMIALRFYIDNEEFAKATDLLSFYSECSLPYDTEFFYSSEIKRIIIIQMKKDKLNGEGLIKFLGTITNEVMKRQFILISANVYNDEGDYEKKEKLFSTYLASGDLVISDKI